MADVSLESPVIQFVPFPHSAGYSCERISVTGVSRLNLKHYASSLHVTLNASDTIPEKLRGKIEVCSHRWVTCLAFYFGQMMLTLMVRVLDILLQMFLKNVSCFGTICRNVSMGLCQCQNDKWKNLQKGQWSTVISAYGKRYIDVKLKDKLPDSITVTVEEG